MRAQGQKNRLIRQYYAALRQKIKDIFHRVAHIYLTIFVEKYYIKILFLLPH